MDKISDYVAVTPSDTVALSIPCTQIFVGGAGDISIKKDADSAAVTFTLVASSVLKVSAAFVMATGTTATNIVAMN